MSNSQRVYHTVLRSILPTGPTKRITQPSNPAWFIIGLFVAAHRSWDGDHDSLVQRLRRVLMNPRLNVRTPSRPTIGYLLLWLNHQERIILVIDRTTIANMLKILVIGIAFRGRVLPLVWKMQKKQGPFQLRYVQAALRFVAEQLPFKPPRSGWSETKNSKQSYCNALFAIHTISILSNASIRISGFSSVAVARSN